MGYIPAGVAPVPVQIVGPVPSNPVALAQQIAVPGSIHSYESNGSLSPSIVPSAVASAVSSTRTDSVFHHDRPTQVLPSRPASPPATPAKVTVMTPFPRPARPFDSPPPPPLNEDLWADEYNPIPMISPPALLQQEAPPRLAFVELHESRPYQERPTSLQATWYTITATLFLEIVPQQVYLHFLLRFPSLYFSRVTRIFQDANLGMGEIKRMALEAVELDKEEGLNRMLLNQGVFPQEWHSGGGKTSASYMNLRHSWQGFIDPLMREWKTLNIISVLLLSAILTILQIESAAANPLTRFSALLSLVCAFMSLIYGCLYIIRFGTMRKTHKAAEWANESERTSTSIFWNVWVMLAMPAVWLGWSMIFYIICIMSFVWQTGTVVVEQREFFPTDLDVLIPRIVISCVLGLGVVYLLLMGVTFRRYSDPMEQAWQERVQGWLAEKAQAAAGYYYPHSRKGKPTYQSYKKDKEAEGEAEFTPFSAPPLAPTPPPPIPIKSQAKSIPRWKEKSGGLPKGAVDMQPPPEVVSKGLSGPLPVPYPINPFTAFARAPPVVLGQSVVRHSQPGSRSSSRSPPSPEVNAHGAEGLDSGRLMEDTVAPGLQHGAVMESSRRDAVTGEGPFHIHSSPANGEEDPTHRNRPTSVIAVPLKEVNGEALVLEEMEEVMIFEWADLKSVQNSRDGEAEWIDGEQEQPARAMPTSTPIPRQLLERGMANPTWERFCEEINSAWTGAQGDTPLALEEMVQTVDTWNGYLDPFNMFLVLLQVEDVVRQDEQPPSDASRRYSLYLGPKEVIRVGVRIEPQGGSECQISRLTLQRQGEQAGLYEYGIPDVLRMVGRHSTVLRFSEDGQNPDGQSPITDGQTQTTDDDNMVS